ncbi:MAG: hypothetical protein HXS42_05255 [Theionarchaea archaeon]|nr:hypothetical protein [Theionarchaea archaeon]
MYIGHHLMKEIGYAVTANIALLKTSELYMRVILDGTTTLKYLEKDEEAERSQLDMK